MNSQHPLITISPIATFRSAAFVKSPQLAKNQFYFTHRKSEFSKFRKFCTINSLQKVETKDLQVNGSCFESKSEARRNAGKATSCENEENFHDQRKSDNTEEIQKKKYTYFIRKITNKKDNLKFYRQNLLQPCKISPILFAERLCTPKRRMGIERKKRKREESQKGKKEEEKRFVHEKKLQKKMTEYKIAPWNEIIVMEDSNF